MRGERLMAIVIGLIMIFSMLGFAATSIVVNPTGQQTVEIQPVVRSGLDKDMKIFILRTGRVLIEHFYPAGCQECMEMNAMLEVFASQFSGFVVAELVEVPENETMFQAIGSAGRITELSYNMTQQDLMGIFCGIAIKQPRECLLGEMFGEESEEDIIFPLS
jgi:hypothetical protein